jgi:hypothetical protein
MVMIASGNGLGGGGFGNNGTMSFNSTKNATPKDDDTLAKLLRGMQLNPYGPKGNGLPTGTQTSGPTDISWFFRAIQGATPNGLPEGTQTSDLNGNDAAYTLKRIGSGILGYPEEGVFSAPRPKGLL